MIWLHNKYSLLRFKNHFKFTRNFDLKLCMNDIFESINFSIIPLKLLICNFLNIDIVTSS